MSSNEVHDPDEGTSGTSTRRDFVKTGVALTGSLMLTGIYAKPSIESIDLAVVPNPSGDKDKKKKKDKDKDD